MVNPLNTLGTDMATTERLLQEAEMSKSVLIYDIMLHHLEQPLTHVPVESNNRTIDCNSYVTMYTYTIQMNSKE